MSLYPALCLLGGLLCLRRGGCSVSREIVRHAAGQLGKSVFHHKRRTPLFFGKDAPPRPGVPVRHVNVGGAGG